MTASTSYSVIMFVEGQEEDFDSYLLDLHAYFRRLGADHEFIVAVNGSGSYAAARLDGWPDDGPELRLFEFGRRLPSGACLQALVPEIRGETLVVCGPYQQIAEESLDDLRRAVVQGEADIALPWRRERVDPLVNQLQSRVFNRLVRSFTGAEFHDLSCTLRVLRRQVLEEVALYGDLYRYLPLLARKRGFRVQEIPVAHVHERGKVGYYGASAYLNRITDIVTMGFNFGFLRQPLRYFGPRGIFFLACGLLFFGIAVVQKTLGTHSLGNSPFVMIGLAMLVAGVLLWGIGLLGEILTFTLARKQKEYVVEEILE